MLNRHGLFAFAIVLQLVLLASVPAAKIRARYWGREITLQTRPVDPYDILAGYYVTLGYAVEEVPTDLRPSGLPYDSPVWLEVAPGDPAWTLVAVHEHRPEVGPDHVLLRGVWGVGRASLPAARRLYIPEGKRTEVDQALRDAEGRGLVDLKVGSDGTPVVLRLRVSGRTFGD